MYVCKGVHLFRSKEDRTGAADFMRRAAVIKGSGIRTGTCTVGAFDTV